MLSLILPSYNGSEMLEKSLLAVQTDFKSIGEPFEIIVVDDGSIDDGKTQKVCEDYGVRFFRLAQNSGKGAAVKKGVSQAKGAVIIFTDVDLPFGTQSVLRLFEELKKGNAEVCIGDRNLPESVYYHEVPAVRKFAGYAFSKFISTFILKGNYDTQCGLKGFTRKAAQKIFSRISISGFAFDVELLMISRFAGFDVKSVPVNFESSQPGVSPRLLRNALNMLVDLFRIKYNAAAKKYNN